MTKEEQLNWLHRLKSDISYVDFSIDVNVSLERKRQYRQVLSEAIKALEQEPTIQEFQAESDKFDAAFQDGYDTGYAQARFDYEQEAYNKGYEDGVRSINFCPYCGEYIGEEE